MESLSSDVFYQIRAYQRNKLYPVFLVLSDEERNVDHSLQERLLSLLRELSVYAALSDKDRHHYESLTNLISSFNPLTPDQRKFGMKIIQILLRRMRLLTRLEIRNVSPKISRITFFKGNNN